jgi:hypothetical protein
MKMWTKISIGVAVAAMAFTAFSIGRGTAPAGGDKVAKADTAKPVKPAEPAKEPPAEDAKLQGQIDYLQRASIILRDRLTASEAGAKELREQLNAAKAETEAAKKTAAEAKKIASARIAPEATEAATKLMKAAQQADADGSTATDITVSTRTGTAADIREASDAARKLLEAQGGGHARITIGDPPVGTKPDLKKSGERVQVLRDSIKTLEKEIRARELTLSQAQRNARNDTEDPGRNELRRAQIKEMEVDLEEANEKLARMKLEFQELP